MFYFVLVLCIRFSLSNDELAHHKTIYEFSVKNIDNEWESLEKYRDNIVIFVNVASYCGYTDSNYRELKELQEKYYDKGLRVAAFPCNQFGQQEPGGIEQITNFIKQSYNYEPEVYAKIDVNGPKTDKFWKFLKSERGSTVTNDIPWNFSKFLVDKNGHVVKRYSHSTNPMSFEQDILDLI